MTTFRASPPNNVVDQNMGLLAQLPGHWVGHGFNLIAKPNKQNGGLFDLELNATKETLDFRVIGGSIPNRGSEQGDVFLHGLHYLQQVSDRNLDSGIHIEPGLWLHVPATTDPPVPETYVRQATIPHGDSVLTQSTFTKSVAGGPLINPVDSLPFTGAIPSLNASSATPVTDPTILEPYQNSLMPPGMDPSFVPAHTIKDPTLVLIQNIAKQSFVTTDVIVISSAPPATATASGQPPLVGGGILNIPFVGANANAAQLDAIFWVETAEDPAHGQFLQLQYVQRVILSFGGIQWPHISVGTLVKQ